MAAFAPERVTSVHHWNSTLFSFRTTRDPGLRFHNGHFVMIGLEVEGRPLMRAYSIASSNHEEHLEFLSIKVPDGPLTSRLQLIRQGDEVLISRKPTGSLLLHDLKPGKRLYLLSTGTGAAPVIAAACAVRGEVTHPPTPTRAARPDGGGDHTEANEKIYRIMAVRTANPQARFTAPS